MTTLDSFGEALLTDLQDVVDANAITRTNRRKHRRWYASGGIAAAAAIAGFTAIGLSPVGPGPEPAFAVTTEPNGTQVVTVHGVTTLDQLAAVLRQHRIRLDTTSCGIGRPGTSTRLDLVSQLIACRDKTIKRISMTQQGDGFVVTIPPTAPASKP